MADDDIPGDDIEGRTEAFFGRMGVDKWLYFTAIQRCVARAVVDPVDVPQTPWRPIGGRNIGGRIRALAQDPYNPLVLYAGAALGGVFKSSDGGDTWAPLGRPEDSFPVGALAIDAVNPNVLYVGTGEPATQHAADTTAWDRAAAGVGLLRCDQGVSPVAFISEVGSFSADSADVAAGTRAVVRDGAADRYSRIVVDPNNTGRCWIASNTGLWRREPGPPVRFVREPVPAALPVVAAGSIQNAPLGATVTDVVLSDNPNSPGTYRLFAGMSSWGVFRGTYDPAAGGNAVWDAAELGGGLPAKSVAPVLTHDRIRLGICRSFPNHVYALIENGLIGDPDPRAVLNVYHSANGGDLWTPGPVGGLPSSPRDLIGDSPAVDDGGQPWGHLVLDVHPDNPAIAVAGGLNLIRTRDFGATWERIIHSTNYDAGDRAQHADQHALMFDAADPRRLWVGNDAGISMAPDIAQTNPITENNWRRRSNGIFAAQFNDVAVHPTYPFMMGGGLQDNGTYITFGGETWHRINGADGGQMAFEIDDPRTFIAPWQSRIDLATVEASATTPRPSGQRSLVNADLDPPNDAFVTNAPGIETGIALADLPLFIPVVEHHPSAPNHFLVGRRNGAAYVTANRGANYNPVGFAAPLAGSISALAYGIGADPAATNWWVGTDQGELLLRRNAGANPTQWNAIPTNPVTPGDTITRICVHPTEERYVAVATASPSAPHQGQVFITLDRGANWLDITGLPPALVAAPPLQSLPPSPISSLAFDPQPAANVPQVLFAGTLAGVYVIRNLPRRRTPAAVAAVPPFNPQWFTFNAYQGDGPLPLTLVNDLKMVRLPPVTGAPANSPESVNRHRLIAALYGRGMYVCDITNYPAAGPPRGGPRQRLYIRQTVIEDGLTYPRPTPATLNTPPSPPPAAAAPRPQLGGDPRLPTAPAPFPLLFTDRLAFDIRVDNAPFQFFEGVMDGVEFDEDLRTKPVKPGEKNVIYVQVHSSGWRAVPPVTVHLYFAEAPAPGAAIDPPLPNLHADFWPHWTDDPLPAPAAPLAANAAAWQRAGKPATLTTVGPNQPAVARFEWVPPVSLVGHHAALMAVCTTLLDPLPAGLPVVMNDLVRRERRIALRVAPVAAFVPDLFIRDGLDDDGNPGGVAFGGRSPDIIVVAAAPVDPAVEYKDLGDPRSADRVRGGGGANVIYVRVHNRKDVAVAADVELFWTKPSVPTTAAADLASPAFDNAKWRPIAPAIPADALNIPVPARGYALAKFSFNAAPAPEADFPNALAFIALIKASVPLDPVPTRTRVTDHDNFWRFFRTLADSNNAALRALRYE